MKWHLFTCIGFVTIQQNGCHCCSITNFLQNIFFCVQKVIQVSNEKRLLVIPLLIESSMANSSQVTYLCQTSTTSVVLPVIYTLISLTGLPGNAISLWVFMKNISRKTSTHIYLINLGISNLILCLTVPFLAAYYAFGSKWAKNNTMCQIAISGLTPVLHINICIGVMILSWVALSRFASLIQHSHANRPSRWLKVLPGAFLNRKLQARLAYALCLVTWIIVSVSVIPFVVLYSIRETVNAQDDGDQVCYSLEVEVGGAGSHIFALVAVSLFFVFFLLVLCSYMAVIRHIWRSKKSAAISDSQRVYARVFRNIVIIKIVLVVCLLPHHIYKAIFINMVNEQLSKFLLKDACHPLSVQVEVKNVLLCLATLRCSTDPIMYFLLDRTFRKHTISLLRMRPRPQESHSSKSYGGQASQAPVDL